MPSLIEKIRAKKAAEAAAQIRPPGHQLKPSDISIKGAGFTKREGLKNQREYDRQASKSLKSVDAISIAKTEKEFSDAVAETIAEMQERNKHEDIKYDPSQLAAIAGIIHNKVSVLIGAAGTGKTTVTKKIVQELAKRVNVVKFSDSQFVTVDVDGFKKRMLQSTAIRMGLWKEPDKEMPGIAFAAYTGRATQQIKRALPEEWHKSTSTIHALLGYAPVFEEMEYEDAITGVIGTKEVRRFRPSFDMSCKLPYTFYVLDEASMVPIPLFNELIDAIHETSRILLIGDIHQLPPVYGKSVLGYAMRKWPVFELTTIHRQAAGNAIISNAHRTLSGKSLENASNFHLIGNTVDNRSPDGSSALQSYFLQVVKKLQDLKRYDPYRDAIIVPQNKGMVGTDALNAHFVTMFNPEIKENGVIINKRLHIHTGTENVYFAVKDKVMITANINTVEPPITNGMIGVIESINSNGKYDIKRSQVENELDVELDDEIDLDLQNMEFTLKETFKDDEKKGVKKADETEDQRQASHVLTIKFENGQSYSCSTAGDFRRVVHGYAATCHKSQGGEYPNIIILCHSVNAVMLTQEWLYTAITRARNNVYIICNQRGLDKALARQVIKGKTIQEKIKSYIIETGADDNIGFDKMKYPILWEPREVS